MQAKAVRTAHGAFWAILNAVFGVVLPFLVFVVFARLLTPVEIGTIAFAIALIEILKALGMPGLYEALLHRKDPSPALLETASAILLGAGLLLVPIDLLLLGASSALIGGIGAHRALLACLAVRIPLDLVSLQPQVVLALRLDFRRLALRTVLGNAVAGAAGIAASFAVGAYAGLVIYQSTQSLLTCLVTILGRGLVARPAFHRADWNAIRSEATYATGNRLVAATINSLDQVILAALAGGVSLAFFNLGKRIETTFVTIANSITSVLLQPIFASASGDAARAAPRRGLLLLALLCGLPAVAVATHGPEVVTLLFGRTWLPAAPIVSILAVNGLIRGAGMVPGALLSVTGRNHLLLVTSLASAASGIAAVACLAPAGVLPMALAITFKNAAIVAWLALIARDRGPHPIGTYLADLVLPFVVMIAATDIARPLLPHRSGDTFGIAFSLTLAMLPATLACMAYGFAWHATRSRSPAPGAIAEPGA